MNRTPWYRQLAWVARHTPLTSDALSSFPDSEATLHLCFHLDLKMVPVLEALSRKIRLLFTPCNASTTDASSWEYLEQLGTLQLVPLDWTDFASPPELFLCDLGGALIARHLVSDRVRGALEGTTSGLNHLREVLGDTRPPFPLLDWNDAPLKREIHNEKMVGESLWQTFGEVTRLSLHGMKVGVLGFGPVGRGISRAARARGGVVQVHDPSPAASRLAAFEGFPTPGREQLLKDSRIIVTATGRRNAVRSEDAALLAEGAFLLNSGHSAEEIAPELRALSGEEVLQHVKWVDGPGGRFYLLAEGEMLNLTAGFGDSINGFDLTSAQLVKALGYLVTAGSCLEPGWHKVPPEVVAL